MSTTHEAEVTAAAVAEDIVPIDTDPAAITAVAKFRGVRSTRNVINVELESLKGDLLSLLAGEDAQAFTLGGKVVARRSDVQTNRLDAEALKRDHPDLYAKYMKTTSTVRLTVTD